MNKMEMKDFRKWNEEMVKRYNPENYIFHSNFFIRKIEQLRFQKIVRLLGHLNESFFLDVGCGSGYLLSRVDTAFGIGLDISELMVKTAKERCGKDKIVIQGDAEALPFRGNTFHAICLTEVIEHVPHPRRVLEEVHRVARDDAIIVVTVPNEPFINFLKKIIFTLRLHRILFKGRYLPARKMQDEWHLHVFSLKKLKEVSQGIFEFKKTEAVPMRFVPLRYIVKVQKVKKSKN
mgnify:FL=1